MPEKNQMFKGVLYIFAMQFRPRLMLIYVESCRAVGGGAGFFQRQGLKLQVVIDSHPLERS